MNLTNKIDIIPIESDIYEYIMRCKKALRQLSESSKRNMYPLLLLPNKLCGFIDDFADSDRKESCGISGNLFTVSDVMDFIIEYGDDNILGEDWEKYKDPIIEPTFHEPILKEAILKKARTKDCISKDIEIIRYNKLSIFILIFNLACLLLFLLLTCSEPSKIISDADLFGVIIMVFFFFVLPTIGLLKATGSPINIEHKTKIVYVPRNEEDIARENAKYEKTYKEQQVLFQKEYESAKLLAAKLYEKQMNEYPSLLVQRATYWDNLPKLLNDNIESAFWNCVYQQFESEVDYKVVDQSRLPQRGAQEDMFFYNLMKSGIKGVKTDIKANGYFPDVAIVEKYYFIDIEIDEPYEYKSKLLTHYIGCGDEERNQVFQKNDAFVIRFSEEQIKKQTEQCIELVRLVQDFANGGDIDTLDSIFEIQKSLYQKRWTREEARFMMIDRSRDK